MGYYINLSEITIKKYQENLKSAYLPPSRAILKERIEERFGYFKSIGIKNVNELVLLLKKKDTLTPLSKIDCFSENYLKILLRELNSIHPKPNKIKEFAGISSDTISKLENIGIKDTLKLFEKIKTVENRKVLADSTGISEVDILILTRLTDLSRIKWVGATFAKMLYDLGVDSVEKASKADHTSLHQKINELSKEKSIYKGHIGLNDIKIFVNAAKEVPLEVEY